MFCGDDGPVSPPLDQPLPSIPVIFSRSCRLVMPAEHGTCSFRLKIRAFIYLSIIQVAFYTKPSRFPTVSRVKLISFRQTATPAAVVYPGGRLRRQLPRQPRRARRRMPISVRRGEGQAGRGRTDGPWCCTGPTLGALAALKYHYVYTVPRS